MVQKIKMKTRPVFDNQLQARMVTNNSKKIGFIVQCRFV